MGIKCGIVGLPNVGKSTLFNALTRAQIAAENYPFCTIDPNVGIVPVPDPRLEALAKIFEPKSKVPAAIRFVDIAGLVRGASQGEGLGNQFLSHIREVDAVAHVVRCFEDSDVTHVEGDVDPIRDIETVETELMLADLESLEKRVSGLEKRLRGGDKDAKGSLALIERAIEALKRGKPARDIDYSAEQGQAFRDLQLLSAKPVLYVCNVHEEDAASGNEMTRAVEAYAKARGAGVVVISAKIESELSQLPPTEQQEYLAAMGLEEPGLNRVIREGYKLLNLITYFTAGPKEARAWTVGIGTKAPQAAGVIHTDFEKGFIRAQTIGYEDYVSLGGEVAARDAGKARDEGRDYLVKDGDVMLFKFNV